MTATPFIHITCDYGHIGPFYWRNPESGYIIFRGRHYVWGDDGYFGIGDADDFANAELMHPTWVQQA